MRLDSFASSLPVATILGCILFVAGCATPDPTAETRAIDEQMTYDGLYPVENARADAAWARPDADISGYSKIMLQGVGVQYRPGAKSRMYRASSRRSDFYEITPERKERLKEIFAERFREELAKSTHFTLVDEPGPDVLLIKGGLIDVVSYVPPAGAGNSEIFLDRIGEATLVLEISDSVSEAIIARAVDRRAAEKASGSFRRANSVSNANEVRRLAGIWARILREQLDHYAGGQG